MIRTLCLLALTAVFTVGPMRLATVADDFSSEATSSSLLPIDTGPFEIPDAVPVSLLVRNNGHSADRLIGGSTSVARRVDLHCTHLVDGQRQMQSMPDGIGIPAHGTLILEPGASHLMLVGLQADLVQGETFPLTLQFAYAGEVTVTTRVRRKIDAAGLTPFPPVVVGDLSISFASAPPAPAESPTPEPDPTSVDRQ